MREKKLKVAAYVRVSTELEQQKTSIKTQYSYYLYLILKDPRYILADIYIDDGKSGNTGELPMYFIENHHKAIIEEEQWERAQVDV